jgi:hypothetical protein
MSSKIMNNEKFGSQLCPGNIVTVIRNNVNGLFLILKYHSHWTSNPRFWVLDLKGQVSWREFRDDWPYHLLYHE